MNLNDNQNENALQLRGKKISIFGDSISTLIGYNPKGYNLFFTGGTCQRAGVRTAENTWWGKAEKRHLAVPFLSFNIQRIF